MISLEPEPEEKQLTSGNERIVHRRSGSAGIRHDTETNTYPYNELDGAKGIAAYKSVNQH